MPLKDAFVIEVMRKLLDVYSRFDSRRIRIFLQREGIHIGKEQMQACQCLKSGEENAPAQH